MTRALCIAIVFAMGCGGASGRAETSSARALGAYVAALEQDSPKRAYALLAKDARKQVSFAQFEKQWREHKRERDLQAKALREARDATPDLGTRALVRFKDGKEMSMSRQDAAWRLDRALVGGTVARTPRDAVRALRRAIVSASFKKFVAVLSRRRREALVRMMQSFGKSLSTNLDRHIQELGEQRAEMFWEDQTGRYRVRLVLEDGEWRIDDFDISLREDDSKKPEREQPCGEDDPMCGL